MLASNDSPYTEATLSSHIPKIGYIAMLGDQPMAACFIRRVECDIIAQIDGLTSNKAFDSILRHKAIDMILTQLITEAKAMKLQGLIGCTKDDGVMKRIKELGFKTLTEKLVVLSF